MPARTARLGRSDRLLRTRDYQRVARSGRRVASRGFVVLVAPAWRGDTADRGAIRRLGLTASRKVGNAVVRNRIKRCVREWFRTSRDRLDADVDLVVIARPAAAQMACPEIGRALSKMLRIDALADGTTSSMGRRGTGSDAMKRTT